MLFQIATLLVAVSLVQSQRLCLEDSQCPDNFFCEVETSGCRECLDCIVLNRSLPPNPGRCVKTDEDCGPCFDGWRPRVRKYGKLLYSTKCEPEITEMQFWVKEIFIWCIGACVVAGFLIVFFFLRIFRRIKKVLYSCTIDWDSTMARNLSPLCYPEIFDEKKEGVCNLYQM